MSEGSEGTAPAALFDGESAVRQPVRIRPWAGGLELLGADLKTLARAELRLVERGALRTVLGLADSPDWRLVAEPPLPDDWLAGIAHRDRLTRPLVLRLVATGGVVAAIAALLWVKGGVLLSAAAPLVPAAVTEPMGKAFLAQLVGDQACSTPEAQAALDRLVARLGPQVPVSVTVADWRLANAFAGPGGQVVLTRGLLEAASGPDEVAGVLAHELGHVAHHHPNRALLRHYGVSLFATALGGTTAQTADLGLMLAASRDAEREADRFALLALEQARISPEGLAAFFERQAKPAPRAAAETAGSDLLTRLGGYATTHPSDSERLAAIRAAAGGGDRAPAMPASDWAALKAVCSVNPPARSGD